jgi:hypothetical protein
MKKALLAAAVAGAFVAPTAMAAEGPSVNIYYPMAIIMGDSEENNGATSTAAETIVDGGGSRLMFTWTDSLNNGMSLTAYASFNTASFTEGNGSTIRSRNSHIALTGEMGTIAMGANEHFFEIDAIIDGYGADWALIGAGQGGEGLNTQFIGLTGNGFTRRDTNTVWFNSNDMNGLTFRAAYIMGADAEDNDAADPEGYQVGATYSAGALTAKVAVANYDDEESVAGNELDGTQFVFTYDFGSFSAGIGLIDMEESNAGVQFESNGYFLNVTMPVSTGRVLVNVAENGDQDRAGAAVNDSGFQGWDIGYQHDLSANTYGFVRYAESEKGANYSEVGGTTLDTDALMLGIVFSY